METFLKNLYRDSSKNDVVSVVTVYAPLLEEIQRTDPLLANYRFVESNESSSMSKEILERMSSNVDDINELSTFDRISLFGIALLLPYLKPISTIFTDVEFAFYLFWQMSSRLGAVKQILKETKGTKASPLPYLLQQFNQEQYLFYFPSMFERKTGIDMNNLRINVELNDVQQHVLSLSKYIPYKYVINVLSDSGGDNYFVDDKPDIIVKGPIFSGGKERTRLGVYQIENQKAIGTTILVPNIL